MLSSFFSAIVNLFGGMGYIGIIILMTIESSFIPFPSEIVIPPAGYLASQGKMNIILVILAGSFGSLLGALLNYYLAMYLGRPIIHKLAETKLAKFFLIDKASIEKSEKYFEKNGSISTLIGRLIPVIRQLISIPAGLAKMNIWKFIIYTTLGATIWTTILAILGYIIGSNKELLIKYYKEISKIFLIVGPIIIILYIFIKRKITKNKIKNNLK